MLRLRNWLTIASLSVVSLSANSLRAQVVQLPAIQQFSMSGGATIPDGGTAYLGGNSYSSTGSVSRGFSPFNQNRAFGASSGMSSMSATVQIIDLAAMDEAILNSNVPSRVIAQKNRSLAVSDSAASDADKARKFLSSYSSIKTAREGDPSYRDYPSALGGSGSKPPAVDPSLAESNVRHYLKMGMEAEAANRIQSARVYYKLAIESMTPELMERYQRVLAEREKAEKEKAAKALGRKQF